MPSSERIFQPHELYLPSKIGGDSSGSISANVERNFDEVQQPLQAIGLFAQTLGRGRKRIDLPIDEIILLYRDEHMPTKGLAQRYNVSVGTIYRRLHEGDQESLEGTRISNVVQKRMVENLDKMHEEMDEQWYKENAQELRKEKEKIREDIRNTLGEEFLKKYEQTEMGIKELIRKRDEERNS